MVLPQGLLGGLHASRLDGANLNQLRTRMAALETETTRLRSENAVLLQRFTANEEHGGAVTRRVAALELSLPKLLEALPNGAEIDRSAVTASTGTTATTFDVDGGSVSYSRSPLTRSALRTETEAQPMPAALPAIGPDASAFGAALGPPIDRTEGEAAWGEITERVGTLLVGLAPLLASVEGGSGKRLVAGPLVNQADAQELCGRMARVGIACAAVRFIGEPLPLTN